MHKGKIYVAGIGPGSKDDITPAVIKAIESSDIIVGYKYYFQFINDYVKSTTKCVDTGMKKERQRAEEAFYYAERGNTVCVISSGDAGIYGMVPLIYEMQIEKQSTIEIQVIPGISAFQKASVLLGCPTGHDFCIISLSDLMTPWNKIEKRIIAAATADFVAGIYNPKSSGRYWQLNRLQEIFLQYRHPDTPVGYVRQAGREDQTIVITTLKEFKPEDIDMFTIVLIGNSQSYISNNNFITPRGYYNEENTETVGLGQSIMIKSFKTIESELKNKNIPLDKKWALLHAIHTTADFDMENIFYADDNIVKNLHNAFTNPQNKPTIITDVTMVTSGIRKGAIERLGINVKCYLNDPRISSLTNNQNITRTQAGIRLAVSEHPNALYVFGNAPTALMELCELIKKQKINPIGIIAAPVGFVNVNESKHMVKSFTSIPKIIIEGRKGGSNIAATLVNAILTFDDASQLKPGRDL